MAADVVVVVAASQADSKFTHVNAGVVLRLRIVGMAFAAPGTGFTSPYQSCSRDRLVESVLKKDEPVTLTGGRCCQSLCLWPTCEAKDDSFPKTSV